MPMDLTLAGLTLHVADIDRSLAFYQQLPGAQLIFHLPGRFALLRFGTGRLGLLCDRKRIFHLELECTDLDATYAKFQELGVSTEGRRRSERGASAISWCSILTETWWKSGSVALLRPVGRDRLGQLSFNRSTDRHLHVRAPHSAG
jgi:hypothetical protein